MQAQNSCCRGFAGQVIREGPRPVQMLAAEGAEQPENTCMAPGQQFHRESTLMRSLLPNSSEIG